MSQGEKKLLEFINHFTRFCFAIPVPDQTAETVARKFVSEVILEFGTPKYLLSDQGTQFVSHLLKETCKLLNISKLQTTAFHPQSNGICERFHKSLVDMISHFVAKDAQRWDEYVPYAVMAYRRTPHSVTRFSPYYLVYGREMRLPVEDDLRIKRKVDEVNYEQYVRELAEKLKAANQIVKRENKKGQQKSKQYYDRKAKMRNFEKGDYVYVYNPAAKQGAARKFACSWEGPYPIVEKLSQLTYRIRKDDGKLVVVHVNRIKECRVRFELPKPPLTRKRSNKEKTRKERQERTRRETRIEENVGDHLALESGTPHRSKRVERRNQCNRNTGQPPYLFRSRRAKSDAQVIQEIINEDLESALDLNEDEASSSDSDDVWMPPPSRPPTVRRGVERIRVRGQDQGRSRDERVSHREQEHRELLRGTEPNISRRDEVRSQQENVLHTDENEISVLRETNENEILSDTENISVNSLEETRGNREISENINREMCKLKMKI